MAAPLRSRSNADLCAEADALPEPLVGEVIAGVLYTRRSRRRPNSMFACAGFGWRSERITGHRNDNPIRIVPDWVCEILSDSTRAKDLGPKRELYARQGIKHLWLVEPDAHVLEAFTLGGNGRWELIGTWTEDAVADVAPFDGCPLALERWWLRDE